MAASFDKQQALFVTGKAVRERTGDTTGGLNLAQVDAALRTFGVDLDTRYRLPWADFAARIDAGQGAILQGGYGPIADSRFDAGRGFRGNHAIFVPPLWYGMDPLADGRATGVYKFHGEAYPQQLLRTFAGKLDLTGNGSLLGAGLVYAAFTADRVAEWRVQLPASDYGVFTVNATTITAVRVAHTGGFSAKCTPPRRFLWPSHTSQSLVRVLSGSHGDAALGAGNGQWVRASHAKEV